jgi:transposase
MSFREITMQDVSEVLRRAQAGQSARRIARETGLDRKTVGRYLAEARDSGHERTAVVDEDVARTVGMAVQARPELPPSEPWKALASHHEKLRTWLGGDEPLRLVRVHELLGREGVEVAYSTLRRYVQRELGWRKKLPTVRLDDPPPGLEAQIDFGLMGMVTDADGKARRLYVLLVTLSWSRHMFVWPTFKQTTEEVCAGLDAAWRFFDGVPKHVVLDNATSMVVHASRTDPSLNRSFAEYAEARGFFADTARVRHPKDKARVENQVPYVRERWFAGESLPADITAIRRHAETWCREVAGARVHGTTRRVPRDVYAAEERPQMLPAPTKPFDVPCWSTAKVHPDHHVQVQKALYSVPTRFIGKTLDIRADRSTVRIYLGMELVKTHARKEPGQRSTDANDFPPGKAAWALRDVDAVLRAATARGQHVGEYAARLVAGPLPWLKLRQAYGLLRLCERYGENRVNALCSRALSFGVIDVRRIEGMRQGRQASRGRGCCRRSRDPSACTLRPRCLCFHHPSVDDERAGRSPS